LAEEIGDKNTSDAFMESYSDALTKELSSTTIEKSFARAPHPVTNNEVTFYIWDNSCFQFQIWFLVYLMNFLVT
jgi:hypothetical protein